MKKPNITEGQWEIYIGARMDMNCIATTGACKIGSKHKKIEYERANAKAISAVPEMVDALIEARKELITYQEIAYSNSVVDDSLNKIEKALKKAGVEL